MITKKYLMALSCLAMMFSCFADAVSFVSRKLDVGLASVDAIETDNFVGGSNSEILVIGRDEDENNRLQLHSVLDQGSKKIDEVALHSGIYMYAIGRLAEDKNTKLFFLDADGVVSYDFLKKQWRRLIEASTIFRRGNKKSLRVNKAPFVADVNGDGLSDFLLADFEKTQLFLQTNQGGFAAAQDLYIQAEMRIQTDFRAKKEYVSFATPSYHVFDYDQNGSNDVVFRVADELFVFLSDRETYKQRPLIEKIVLDKPLTERNRDKQQNHKDSELNSFYKMVDLNKDEIPDLITQLTKSQGLLDKSSEYHVHIGQYKVRGNNERFVHYSAVPDSVVSSEGIQFELTIVDYDSDTLMDLISPSFDLGVGSIIASLFSSSAELDVAFHSLNKNGRYQMKPDYKRDITVDFDLGSGQQVYPLFKVNDFDGDGKNDLLLGYESKRLHVYRGENGKRPFAKRPFKFSFTLPQNGQLVTVSDINLDGKSDLVVRYSKLDGGELYKQVSLLLAK